jgi:hypothetical protein
MSTSQNLQAVKGELDFLVALFATNSLIPEERINSLPDLGRGSNEYDCKVRLSKIGVKVQ